jgi:hypothetical protein
MTTPDSRGAKRSVAYEGNRKRCGSENRDKESRREESSECDLGCRPKVATSPTRAISGHHFAPCQSQGAKW